MYEIAFVPNTAIIVEEIGADRGGKSYKPNIDNTTRVGGGGVQVW